MKHKLFIFLLCLSFVSLQAQTSKNEVMNNIFLASSNYYAYPGPSKKLTPAPVGYKPFYISHYGRHGSRYMTSNKYYAYTIEKMNLAEKQNALTSLGQDVLKRLKTAYSDAYLRDGDLSKLGALQHREIANRMYHNYPEVFKNETFVDAKSSTSIRAILSMANFCEELRGLNSKLDIFMDASERDLWYIANHPDSIVPVPSNEEITKKCHQFDKKMFNPDRMIKALFSNQYFVKKNIDASYLMDSFWNIAEDMQNLPELKISFGDLFTKEELFDIWQAKNVGWCMGLGLFPSATPKYKARYNLLRNILDTADKTIHSKKNAVTLRFGHDTYVGSLAYILHLKGCDNIPEVPDSLYKYWTNFKIIPMGGNIQLIFYRKQGSHDVLVKFLLNENESSIPIKTNCAPYYHWKDVEAYYRSELKN